MEDLVTGLIQCTVYPMVMTLIWKIVTGWEIYVICGVLNNAGCNFRSVRFSRPLPRAPPPPSLLVSNRFNLLDHRCVAFKRNT